MRIPPAYIQTTKGSNGPDKVQGDASGPKVNQSAQTDAAAKVEVSEQARVLAARVDEPVDHKKVDRLKNAIEANTFRTDAEMIARMLVGGGGELG